MDKETSEWKLKGREDFFLSIFIFDLTMTSVKGKKSSWNQNAYLSDTEEKTICVRHIREIVQEQFIHVKILAL